MATFLYQTSAECFSNAVFYTAFLYQFRQYGSSSKSPWRKFSAKTLLWLHIEPRQNSNVSNRQLIK